MESAQMSLWRRLYYTRFRDAVRGRFDASLDRRKIVADAGLSPDVAEMVLNVVRRSKLWRREQVDVAKELVAHFQDGLASGQSSQQLVASFGDVQQAAELIRRAKKRGRPLTWHVWHYSWICVTTLLVAYVATGLYMMTDRPTIKIDYLAIINQRAASLPDSERAWPLYRAALLALGAKRSELEQSGAEYDAKPGDENWPKIEKLLGDHADSIAQLRTAAQRRDLGFVTASSLAAFTPEDRKLFGVSVTQQDVESFNSQTLQDRWLISTLLPHLRLLKTSAYLLAADARRAAQSGDADTAMADTVALLGVSNHCDDTPFLVNLLVANAVKELTCRVIDDTLADHPQLWSDEQLRVLAHMFAAAEINWRRGLSGENTIFEDTMQRLYTDDGHGDGRLAFRSSVQQNVFQLLDSFTGPGGDETKSFFANDGLAMLVLPAANMVVASRKDTTETYQRFIQSVIVKIETPLWAQQELAPDDELLSDQAGPIERYRYMFVRLLVPAYDKLRNNVATTQGKRDGVLIGLALELYHREHKGWPATLDELSPRWLPSVPVDRITGQPLHYKIVDDRPVVYSVGVDRDDDGGKTPLGDDGKPDADLASPQNFKLQPVTGKSHDGDWVIWSTVPDK